MEEQKYCDCEKLKEENSKLKEENKRLKEKNEKLEKQNKNLIAFIGDKK